MTFVGILLALAAERALGHLPRVGEPMVLEQLMVRLQRAVPLAAYWRSWASPVVLLGVGTALAGAGIGVDAAEVVLQPKTLVPIQGNAAAQTLRLLEILEDHDDVQRVSANFDIDDDELKRLSA